MSLLRPVNRPTLPEVVATALLMLPFIYRTADLGLGLHPLASVVLHIGRLSAMVALIALAGKLSRKLKKPVTERSSLRELADAFAALPSSLLGVWLPTRICWPAECAYNAHVLGLIARRLDAEAAAEVHEHRRRFERCAAEDEPLEMWIGSYRRLHRRLRDLVLSSIQRADLARQNAGSALTSERTP